MARSISRNTWEDASLTAVPSTFDAAWVLKSNTSMKSSGSKQLSGSSTQREQSIYLMLVSAALRKDTPTLNSSYP